MLAAIDQATGNNTMIPQTKHRNRTDPIWLLGLITACITWPWLTLRRVPVTVQRPSSHAAIAHLDYGVTPATCRRSASAAARCASGTPSRR